LQDRSMHPDLSRLSNCPTVGLGWLGQKLNTEIVDKDKDERETQVLKANIGMRSVSDYSDYVRHIEPFPGSHNKKCLNSFIRSQLSERTHRISLSLRVS
jgi:hypothetical protein